jgi:hypothetical protein
MILAVSAAALPIAGYRNEFLIYGVGGLAIVVGLAAVGLSFAARRSLLESAVTAVCLAVAGVVFSIDIAVTTSQANTAAEAAANAKAQEEEVRKEREKGEAAQRSAAEMLKKAEEAPARAEAALRKAEEAEARAAEAPRKAAQMLEQVKAEQAKLDKNRNQLAEQTAALAAERAKVEDAKAKLDEQRREVEASKKEAASLAKKAEEDKLRGKELLEKAEQKEKEAQELNKRVREAIDGVKDRLKGKAPQDRKAAIATLARIGAPAASADYDLCQVAAFDPVPKLRRDALDALEKVQPKLYPLVVTLMLPPEGNDASGYARAIRELPTFGRAGLPVITAQLQGKDQHVTRLSAYFPGACREVLAANVEALSKIAAEDQAALSLLLTVPDSPLAVATKQNRQIDGAVFDANLRRSVGEKLLALGKDKPGTRKAVVPYFIALLQSMEVRCRLLGVNALAALGPDAKIAVVELRKLSLDPSEQVRDAVRDAIALIEKAPQEKPAEVPASNPPDKPSDKPLLLKDLIAREAAQRVELAAARRSGNDNAAAQLEKKYAAERDSWRGKPVEGVAVVSRVTGNSVYLYTEDVPAGKRQSQRIRFVNAVAKSNDDPLLGKLRRENVVAIRGILSKQGRPFGDTFTVEETVFTLKK